jgi:crotonobetainyl-CoA:carnitine CoA-transferase CaiB-like acyl-CoA transferase
MSMPLDTQPLAGLRVLDLSRLLPGPYATLVLADLGADVIKIEAPEGGDYLRWMPPLTGKVSWAFFALNAGKRSLALDLKHPEGAEILRALAREADVLLESFRPGVMDRLGLGYDALAALNPRLVYCALTGFGHTGPYRDAPGHDLNYMALAGALGLGGPVDRPPQVPPIQVADIGGSLWSLVAILAALHARHTSGRGRFLDVSMTDGVTGFLTAALAPHIGAGATPPARGADVLTGGLACYGVYATSDGGFVTVASLEPKFWLAFCQRVGRPEWVKRQFDPTLRAEVAALMAERSRAEWESLFAGSEAMVEPVLAPAELASHPLHRARGLVIEGGGLKRIRTPIRPADAPACGKAPGLGEHSRQVLAEAGLSAEQIARLIEAGVVKGMDPT